MPIASAMSWLVLRLCAVDQRDEVGLIQPPVRVIAVIPFVIANLQREGSVREWRGTQACIATHDRNPRHLRHQCRVRLEVTVAPQVIFRA